MAKPRNHWSGPRPETVETIQAVRRCWQDGDSAGTLSKKLAKAGVVFSRGSIIGLFNRHGDLLKPAKLRVIEHVPHNAPIAAPRVPKAKPKHGKGVFIKHREELVPQGQAMRYDRVTHHLVPAMPRKEWVAKEVPLSPNHRGLTLLELKSGECKFPHGDAAPFSFCGAAAEGTYCNHHARLVIQPPQQRKRR